MTRPRSPCIVGLGNAWRRDDGVGLEVVRRLRGRVDPSVELLECHGDLSALLLQWGQCGRVIVIDAMRSGATVGTIRRFEPLTPRGAAELWGARRAAHSTHAIGLVQAIQLATQLDLLPSRLSCFAVEAGSTAHGSGLSPLVAASVEPLIAQIMDELEAPDADAASASSTDA